MEREERRREGEARMGIFWRRVAIAMAANNEDQP